MAARHSCPGPSEAEVGRRLVNPSRSATRLRSRRAYRHISSLRSASRWHMIAVRQAGSFHTGRSAQSPRRRKPISPVTSVAEGQEPRIHADSIRQVHPPAAMVLEAVDCGVPSGTRLLSPDVPASRAAAASSDRDPRHTGSTGIRGTCVNGPPTALAAVVPFGPVGTSACGPSMGRRTGDARTPCRARPRLLPSWRRGPP